MVKRHWSCLNPLRNNGFFLLVRYKLAMAHCIYWGVTGYNFQIILFFFFWRLILSSDRSKAVLLWIICVFCVLYFSCFRVCSLLPCGHLLGKGWPVMFIVFCYFPMWYPGSGVVLDCIVSWSLPSFLLKWQTVQSLMKCCMMRHFIWVFTDCQSTCLGVWHLYTKG